MRMMHDFHAGSQDHHEHKESGATASDTPTGQNIAAITLPSGEVEGAPAPRSSSGLGLRPFTAATRIRIPYGVCKSCTMCSEEKPLDAFNRKSSSRDGRQSFCRECSAGLYAKHREKAKARSRRYTIENREKRRAHRKLEYAIEVGRITRGFCECCGTEKADAHHHKGYDNPYDVQWLCRSCHVTVEPRRVAS